MKERINNDFKSALLNKDKVTSETLKLIKNEIKNKEISNKVSDLTDNEIVSILQKEASKRIEMIDVYTENNRQDLVDIEKSELDVINNYLPKVIDDNTLDNIINKVLETNKNMGQVIKDVKSEVTNIGFMVDGKLLAGKVKEKLK